MTLYLFNPEHDLALASGLSNFTSPHAGRQLHSDLCYLPALWAEPGDAVLVDDVECAMSGLRKLKLKRRISVSTLADSTSADIILLRPSQVATFFQRHAEATVSCWGWDKTIAATLRRMGVPADKLPSDAQLDQIRLLSNRSLAVELLARLAAIPSTSGHSVVCHTIDGIHAYLADNHKIVVKAPWSSSGRGVRYLTDGAIDQNVSRWMHNTIQHQHTLIAERYCDKVRDFAMEYTIDAQGKAHYAGLSLFDTMSGAYTGNLLMSEEEKEEIIHRYVSPATLLHISDEIVAFLEQHVAPHYSGALGVDMMVCRAETEKATELGETKNFTINPCVEINLRSTMGHVALALSHQGQRGAMAIDYDGHHYKFIVHSS